MGRSGMLLLALLLAGCADPLFERSPCTGEAEAELILANRNRPAPIGDGSEIDVFPPPQGGVFTELDVSLRGIGVTETFTLEISIAQGDGTMLAETAYRDDEVAAGCLEDGTMAIEDLPVGFADGTVLEELDALDATLQARLTGERASALVEHAVTLRVTDYGPIPPPQ